MSKCRVADADAIIKKMETTKEVISVSGEICNFSSEAVKRIIDKFIEYVESISVDLPE